MTNLLTYYNIRWEQYLYLFEKYDDTQVLFFIPSSQKNKCLQLDNNIVEISGSKINKLDKIGPYITLRNKTFDFDGKNIEEAIMKYYYKNRFSKWIGIINDDQQEITNIFINLNKKYNIMFSATYLIPHRNREEQLKTTVEKINYYIKENNLDADIWVCQQDNKYNWNKGCILNIGFKILHQFYQYFIFNDCDTFVERIKNFNFPKENEIIHIYGYPYCLGGIFCSSTKNYLKINGFNNNFFNWGREDREIEDRCKLSQIKINRENIINIKQNGACQLEHSNTNNYWNFKEKDSDYLKARQLYYFNQIEHFNNNDSGITNLQQSSDTFGNIKYLIFINLFEWTDGIIQIEDVIKLILRPSFDTGVIDILFNETKISIPINPSEKYPKILLTISQNSITLKINYFLEKTFTIPKLNNFEIKNIQYQNINLDYDLITTQFNSSKIKYSYLIDNKSFFNLMNIKF